MTASTPKNKTTAAWLAFIFGQFGLHRFYLFGLSDLWGWAHPIVAAIGWYGVERVQAYGQDDQVSWLLIPLLGFAQHNPGTPEASIDRTNWLTMGAIVLALLFGTIALMSSIAFSFQRYFEYQVEEARKISQ